MVILERLPGGVRRIALVGVVAALSGCAGVEYKDAAGDRTARLRVVQNASARVTSYAFAVRESCRREGPKGGVLFNERSESRKVGMAPRLGTDFMSSERIIPADADIALLAGASTVWSNCTATLRFTPRSGEQYEAVYLWPASAPRCTLQLRRIVVSESGAVSRTEESGASRCD
jgi:hypothetical protein